MTAIVAILNKHCAAIAADSAVTIGNTHKVINSANKIFTLSKYYPVAVMTYNNASFMGVPWDIIIKEYRKQLKDRSFSTLKEYVNDFIKFMHDRNFFSSQNVQDKYLLIILNSFVDILKKGISQRNNIDVSNVTNDLLENDLQLFLTNNKNSGNRCPEYVDYEYQEFRKNAISQISTYASQIGFTNVDLLSESFFYYLSATLITNFSTGLVFVGYGEEEIYPSLLSMDIVLAFDNHLRYFFDNRTVKIGDEPGESLSCICPFAQSDVVQTLIDGIHPAFLEIINNAIGDTILSISAELNKIPNGQALSQAFRSINYEPIIQAATREIGVKMRKTYTNSLLDTVNLLDKEDMANMAESFISLTSLVRHMQPGEETVGGPVDVAVISKGDGFVWINRKHYFKPEINKPFFDKYFKV